MQKEKEEYEATGSLYCPFFKTDIALTSDGFNHLLYKPNRLPRNSKEQNMKLSLLTRALQTLRVAGTVQEYRNVLKTKQIQYWAFHDVIFRNKETFLIRVVVRQIDNGKLHFWSVMPVSRSENRRFYRNDIENN